MAVDKKKIFTQFDWDSPNYSNRRGKQMVIYFTQSSPIDTREHRKVVADVTNENSEFFQDTLDIDVIALDRFFRDRFGDKMETRHFRNYRLNEANDELAKLNDEGWNYDSFFFILLTYCKKKYPTNEIEIQFQDQFVHVDYVFNQVKTMESLAFKPKIFIIQADDRGILRPDMFAKALPEHIEVRKVPTDADRLMIMSTIPQELSALIDAEFEARERQQNPDRGVQPMPSGMVIKNSVLIKALVKVLEDHILRDEHLLRLTPRIVGEVDKLIRPLQESERYKSYEIPLPLVTSTLTRKMFL